SPLGEGGLGWTPGFAVNGAQNVRREESGGQGGWLGDGDEWEKRTWERISLDEGHATRVGWCDLGRPRAAGSGRFVTEPGPVARAGGVGLVALGVPAAESRGLDRGDDRKEFGEAWHLRVCGIRSGSAGRAGQLLARDPGEAVVGDRRAVWQEN